MRVISELIINVNEIKNNINFIKNKIGKNQKYCFVAKANCYGLGIKLCGLIEDQVDCFAVSSALEFFALKKYVKKDILILDPIYKNITKCVKANAILTISNLEVLEKTIKVCKKNNLTCRVHLAINTGMNRFGFKDEKELINACRKIKKTQFIVVEGVFSHYYQGNLDIFVENQNRKFINLIKIVERYFGKNLCFHIAATDASIIQPYKFNSFSNMVRIGMGSYSDKFFETITLNSTIIEMQKLTAGESAGYGRIFTAKEDCTLATVGIGYGDGIFRNIVNNGYVLINNEYCKIIAVCMDAILVDVSKISANIGDKVTVIGAQGKNQIFICDLASWCDTIDYEIIVRLSNRIKRKYLR